MTMNKKSCALIFEVTHGCQYSCSGCTVNKSSTDIPDKATFGKIHAMLDNFVDNGVKLIELEIGPTDITTALNRDALFDNEDFAEMVKRFIVFTMPTGLLLPRDGEYIRLAKQVSAINPGGELEIVTPVELTHVFNDKYLRTIEHNANVVKDHLDGKLIEVVLQVNFDSRFLTKKQVGMPSVESLFERIHSLDMPSVTKVNFTLPQGRKTLADPLHAGNFLDAFKLLNELYMKDLKKRGDKAEPRHVPYQLRPDIHGGELTYHNGEMYVRPILNERFTLFSDDLKFPEPWTYEGLAQFAANMTNRSLDKAMAFEDCQSCEHIVTCANRGVHELMAITQAPGCITLLKDYGHLSPQLQNGEFDKINWNDVHVPSR